MQVKYGRLGLFINALLVIFLAATLPGAIRYVGVMRLEAVALNKELRSEVSDLRKENNALRKSGLCGDLDDTYTYWYIAYDFKDHSGLTCMRTTKRYFDAIEMTNKIRTNNGGEGFVRITFAKQVPQKVYNDFKGL
jgi:hypothetical protein